MCNEALDSYTRANLFSVWKTSCTFLHFCRQSYLLSIHSTGYPGQESQHRAAMLNVLGKEKQEFFFDKFLEYFFMEEDAKFFASLGLNCIRIPFNYRHFEDDMNPRVLKKSGFKHLDRVIELVYFPLPTVPAELTGCMVVCEASDIHNPGYAHSSGRAEPGLAL